MKLKLRTEVKILATMQTPEGLSEGYSYFGIGNQRLTFMTCGTSLKKLNRCKNVSNYTDEWRPIFILDLPYEVDKKFYQTGKSSLEELTAAFLQIDGELGWFSTNLKKNNVEPTKFDGQSTVSVRKGDLLRKMTALGISCKSIYSAGWKS
jgi:hypothetical protein